MKLIDIVAQIYQRANFGPVPNLLGDRDVEYSFVAANLPAKKGKVLDFGSGNTPLSLISYLKGNQTTAIDLLPEQYKFKMDIKFIHGDILKNKDLQRNYFDTIINCSSIEHVGLSGRYGVAKDIFNGDFEAMSKLRDLLKKGGLMILTIPVGKDMTVKGMHRIYGRVRLPKLLKGFKTIKQSYWIKNYGNLWYEVEKGKALQVRGSDKYYGLGCFVLSK